MKIKGFTLLELLISLTIFSVIIGSVTTVFLNSQATKQRVDQMTQAQQAARTAIDYMIRDIRAAGYNIDIDETETSSPQRRVVYASPYEIVFNSNILPAEDVPDDPTEPRAMKVTASLDERPAHYYPTAQYNTGAETVVYTLDWNNDGIINADDRTASPAGITGNPDDYCLIKRVYGLWDSGLNYMEFIPGEDEYDWTNQELVSIVGGPDRYPSQSSGTPMFLYWIDNDGDATTPADLYGDSDGDGEVSPAEANAMAPITNIETLEKIEIVTVNITGVSSSSYRGKYQRTNISTDVGITRNVSIKVYLVKGHVYEDADADSQYETGEAGIADMKVKLSTGEISVTDEDGIWTFALIPGTYGVSVTPQILWRGTTALNFDFSISNNSIDFTTDDEYMKFFGMEQTPSANIAGIVFHDLNGDGVWQPTDGEVGLPDMSISVWNNSTKSYDSPPDSEGFYNLLVNAEESLYVWIAPPDSFAASGVDLNDILGINTAAMIPTVLSTSSALAYLNEGETAYVGFGLIAATGTRPTVQVIYPNGGEILLSGSANNIKVYANPNDTDGTIKNLIFYYSVDGADNYRLIDEVESPTMVNDTYNFTWIIPDTVQGSQICLIKVGAVDDGNWTVYDESDNYFTIVATQGFTSFYFTNEYVDSFFDDTLYLYSFGNSFITGPGMSGPLPRYLNTVNSRTMGVVSDSLPDSDGSNVVKRPFYTQLGQFAEFTTKKGMPYADTIYPGKWIFYIYGSTDAWDNDAELKWYDFDVYKCDSFGTINSRVKLFSTIPDTFATPIHRSLIGNYEEEDTTIVTLSRGFTLDRNQRLYIKVYYSGEFTNTGGPSGDISPKIYMTFGADRGTKLILPPKP